ncbi:hypothetical protein MMC10_007332 [Thelotrema lepadinum]|nr:hypothetical protein [Thelotrema lepadinum]
MADIQHKGLLEYDAEHRIVICTQCHYAIQPNAISRHLKDLHHIYRGQKRALLETLIGLELSDPLDIVLPGPEKPPVKSLPIDSGLACNNVDCGHLCITSKRMKRHWVTRHDQTGVEGISWRPVRLQTFFRGSHLRYFIVNSIDDQTHQSNGATQDHQDSTNRASTRKSSANTWLASCSATDTNDKLLEHYLAVTYKTLVERDEEEDFWRTSILRLAEEHAFVMHAILATSALHLAWLHPAQRRQNTVVATLHQQKALPLYQAAMDHPDEHNCHALFAFASILAVLEFAAPKGPEDLLLLESTDDRDGLPRWLHLVRGGCTLLGFLWSSIAAGPARPLIGAGNIPVDVNQCPDDPALVALLPLFSTGSDILQSADILELDVYKAALEDLRRVFAHSRINAESFKYRYLIQLWPANVPQVFIDLLNDLRPGALVLLTYYCVLIKRAQGCWYLQGSADQLMGLVQNNLDAHLAPWVRWPSQEMESLDLVEEPSFLAE